MGLETDFDWSRIHGTGTSNFLSNPGGPGGPSNFQEDQNVNWFGTVRARLGFLPTNNLLVYGTAGLAYGHVKENVALNSVAGNGLAVPPIGFACVTGSNCFSGSSSRTVVGWTAGAGLEYKLGNNVSIKSEYLYVNLGGGDSINVVAANPGLGTIAASFTATNSKTDFQVVRGGVNYKF